MTDDEQMVNRDLDSNLDLISTLVYNLRSRCRNANGYWGKEGFSELDKCLSHD